MPDNAQTPLTIDVVSDVVCPWCFIGKSRLEKALALKPDIPVEVLRVTEPLHPPPTPGSPAEGHMAAAMLWE